VGLMVGRLQKYERSERRPCSCGSFHVPRLLSRHLGYVSHLGVRPSSRALQGRSALGRACDEAHAPTPPLVPCNNGQHYGIRPTKLLTMP
jgi:hypothetical protein